MPNLIALVDDDKNILTSVSIALETEGFDTIVFSDSEKAYDYLLNSSPDLVVLDIKMPRMTGMELLEKLRKHSKVPVIFLTSKDDEIDEMLGLRVGADDYIKKPFSQRLLIERIRTILRRQKYKDGTVIAASTTDEGEPTVLTKGNLSLDASRHQCLWKGEQVDLTVTEFLIIETLAKHPGHVKSRDQLIDAAYGEHIYVDDRTIDSHIKRLRRKFKKIDSEFSDIETLYGVGYRLKDPSVKKG